MTGQKMYTACTPALPGAAKSNNNKVHSLITKDVPFPGSFFENVNGNHLKDRK